MKTKLNQFFFIVSLIIILVSVKLTEDNLNNIKNLEIKNAQISKLNEINKINSMLISSKDSSIMLKDKEIEYYKKKLKPTYNTQQEINYEGFLLGDKKISTFELLTLFNKIYKENETNKKILEVINKRFGVTYSADETTITTSYDSTSVINKLISSQKQNIRTIKENENKINSLEIKAKALEVIQKRYGISYIVDDGFLKFPINKVDTLMDVYPLIKNRIKYDKGQRHVWIKGLIL